MTALRESGRFPTTPCPLVSCAGCPAAHSRRDFLVTTGAAVAAGLAAPSLLAAAPAAKPKIRIVYALHGPQQDRPDWPNKGFDFRPVMAHVNAGLAAACPEFEFIPTLASGEEQAKQIAEEDRAAGIAGYLVCQMNCWNRVVQTLAATGKPVIYADYQFGGSGGFLVYNAAFLRAAAPNVGFVASSQIADLIAAVKGFGLLKTGGTAADVAAAARSERLARTPPPTSASVAADPLAIVPVADCLRRMKETRILAVRASADGLPVDRMGIPVVHVPFAEVNEAWKNADKD